VSRHLIIVDIETTGLDDDAYILEVAAIDTATGEELYFAPYIERDHLVYADPQALQINRYYERGVWNVMETRSGTNCYYERLQELLRDNTLGGSNPIFDAQKIRRYINPVWHHRLADLAAYAAGVLGISPTELPGLNTVCDRLGVVHSDPHSALGDARATAECFARLQKTVVMA
jgi:DNA polymerase III subunit epsilon